MLKWNGKLYANPNNDTLRALVSLSVRSGLMVIGVGALAILFKLAQFILTGTW